MDKNNLLQKILFEAQAYNTFQDIEKLVDNGADLSQIPIQPLYVSLISSTPGQLTQVLPKLSKEQRQAFIDLDLWKKDIVDPTSFEFWIEAYSKVNDDELTSEFCTSEDFYLYLKSRVNIYTFDVEDPQYPDHDFYFLSEDNLLLIEYGEDYQYPGELKVLIRNMYDTLGVEGAYTTLFKLMNDSFSKLQEDGFQTKKERLRDYGFVDHYEAMEKLHPFISYGQIKKYIEKKGNETGNIELKSQNQSLHSSALVSFNVDMEDILSELAKVESEKRKLFLHFTFIKLINSTITLKDALRGGRVELTKIGAETKCILDLALDYTREMRESFQRNDESIFEYFDFLELYKIGISLLSIEKTRLKKALRGKSFEQEDKEYFVGSWWSSFLDNSFLEIPKVKNFGVGLHPQHIKNTKTFNFWKSYTKLFSELSAFIEEFSTTFVTLQKDQKLQDAFYLNYDVSDIDFEAIILSSFIGFVLEGDRSNSASRLGLNVNELKEFIHKFFIKENEEYKLLSSENELIKQSINSFSQKYGLSQIEKFDVYLYGILYENLSGYEYDTLESDDYRHVGGPILLNIQ